MLAILVALASLSACKDVPTGDPTASAPLDVHIHAHLDDWQLFMGDRVDESVQTAGKVVLVYATAGDAGSHTAYWQTRERAAQASVERIAGPDPWSCADQKFRTRAIRRCRKGKVVSYYMRMPDGNWYDGKGYGHGSLSLLRDQGTSTGARDGSTTYPSWADFYTTIAEIIDHESGGQPARNVSVHAPDYDRTINSDDHPDHWATADAVRSASRGRGWKLSWYIDYRTEYLDRNLSNKAHAIKEQEFRAYDDVMASAGYETLMNRANFQAWFWRTYFRTQESS